MSHYERVHRLNVTLIITDLTTIIKHERNLAKLRRKRHDKIDMILARREADGD